MTRKSSSKIWKGREKRVESLDELVREIQAMSPTSHTDQASYYWFRGQSNATWDLAPSFLRITGGLISKRPDVAIELERAARDEFKSKAHLYVDPGRLEKVKTNPCWWALMQHHGAPTRLLDWSTSPYVAAYFAAQQDGSHEDGAIWCFCSGNLERTFLDRYGPLPDFEKGDDGNGELQRFHEDLEDPKAPKAVAPLSFPFFSSSRMANQQGRFTLCLRIHEDHGCIASQVGPSKIRKIIIPHEKKPDFLAGLRLMNITAAALFPGVDGLGRSVQELASLGERFKTACDLRGSSMSVSS